MKTIFILVASIVTLFLPIKINVSAFIIDEIKRAFFNVNAFGFIKIISGYLSFNKYGMAIHITKNKAIVIPYKNFINTKKVIKYYKDFHVNYINILVEVGAKNNLEELITASIIYNFIFNNVAEVIKERKPYVKINSNINIAFNNDYFNLYVKTKLYLNLITIFINLFKILMEKMFNAKRKRKNKIEQVH